MVRLDFACVVALTLLCTGVSEEVSKVRKPLVVPLGDQCVFSRDARSLKKRKHDIVRDYYVCNDFSKKRCIFIETLIGAYQRGCWTEAKTLFPPQ